MSGGEADSVAALIQAEQSAPLPPRLNDEEERRVNHLRVVRLYLRETSKEIRHRKLNFCLGSCATTVVVLVLALMLTILANAPILYMALAEQNNGQVDLQLWQTDRRLNFTLADATASRQGGAGRFTYNAPRLEFDATARLENQTTLQPFVGFAIDHQRELRAGVGRSWNQLAPLGYGEIYVSTLLAGALGTVRVGNIIEVHVSISDVIGGRAWAQVVAGLRPTAASSPPSPGTYVSSHRNVVVRCVVKGLYQASSGKHPSSVTGAVLPGDHWLQMMANSTDPNVNPLIPARLSNLAWREYASTLVWNLPPGRSDVYRSSDLAEIESRVTSFISELLARVSWRDMDRTLPVLRGVKSYRFFSLFLGLLLNIIVLFVFALSVMLIYSLLMVSVESRTFELGILRMVGMTRPRLVGLLLCQALAYSVPAIIIGLPLAQGLAVPIAGLLSNLSGVEVSPLLSGLGIGLAILAGLLVPLVAAILPVRAALRANVHSSVDTRRSKTEAVRYKVTRSNAAAPSGPLIIIGLVLFGLAFIVYYLLPLSLLSSNIYGLLNIFFLVLIAMLIGLVVLASNLQPLLERLFFWIFFFWEQAAIRTMSLRNFDAHRRRNAKTALMFAVSLAFIIFLSVTFSVQLSTLVVQENQRRASVLSVRVSRNRFLVDNEPGTGLPVVALEAWAANEPRVLELGWATMPLEWHARALRDAGLEGVGHTSRFGQNVIGVSANLFNSSFSGYVRVDDSLDPHGSPKYSVAERVLERLYSRRGSGSVMLGSKWASALGKVGPKDQSRPAADLLLWQEVARSSAASPITLPGAGASSASSSTKLIRTRMAVESWFSLTPLFSFSAYPSGNSNDVLVSLPSFVRLLRKEPSSTIADVDSLLYEVCLIKLQPRIRDGQITQVKRSLSAAMRETNVDGIEILDTRDATDSLETARQLVGFFFLFTVIIALIICFFSLSSSMYTNIYEQKKEIGVLMAIGIRKGWLRRMFLWEAIIVVFSASFLGIGIGVLVAWTMTLQQALFTQLPVPFEFPWQICLAVIFLSVIFGLLASLIPLSSILKQSPVKVLREAE